MEAKNNIINEFKPIVKTGLTRIDLKNIWDVEAATATQPGNTNNIILTPALLNQYWEGLEIPELSAAIESLTEYYVLDFFRYGNYKLIDSDICIYLTFYLRHDNFKDNLMLDVQPEYNILNSELPGDAEYYFNTEYRNYSPDYYNIYDESLNFLTYTILENNASGTDWKENITSKDVLQAISQQDPQHQEIIRTANILELQEDIIKTYNKIIKELLQEAQENLSTIFYDEIYGPARDAAEQEIINNYINKPIGV